MSPCHKPIFPHYICLLSASIKVEIPSYGVNTILDNLGKFRFPNGKWPCQDHIFLVLIRFICPQIIYNTMFLSTHFISIIEILHVGLKLKFLKNYFYLLIGLNFLSKLLKMAFKKQDGKTHLLV